MEDTSMTSAVEALMRRDAPVQTTEPTNDEIIDEPIEDIGEPEEEVPQENAQEEQEEDEPTFEVEWKGEKKQVTLKELEQGYIENLKGEKRQSDYTAKFQTVAEKERTLTAKEQQLAQEAAVITKYMEELTILDQFLETPPVNPNSLNQLLAEGDTEGFLKAKHELETWQNQKYAIRQRLVEVNNYQATKQQQELARIQAQEKAILQEKAPDLLKEDNAKKLLDYLNTGYGYSPQEIQSIADHRSFIIANKARLYDEMMQKAGNVKKAPNIPKVIKKGSPKVEFAASEDYRKARLQLSKTGSDSDAVRALLLKSTNR